MLTIQEAIKNGTTSRLRVPNYDKSALKVGMAHIGVGNFYRAHQLVYLDDLLEKRPDQNIWGSIGIGLRSDVSSLKRAEGMAKQNCDYTLTEFNPNGLVESRVLRPLISYCFGPNNRSDVIKYLSNPDIKILSLTIGEGGYDIDETTGEFRIEAPHIKADLASEIPISTWGVIVAALKARRNAGVDPFTIVSCDNLRSNGNTTRKSVLGFATASDPNFADWIAGNVAFPNSMVDRIAPVMDEALVEKCNSLSGVSDLIPVAGESFKQWVIEDEFPYGRPVWEEVGVELRPDVEAFEAVKGRTLNASHVIMSYIALGVGYTFVYEGAKDELIRKFLVEFMNRDAFPLVTPPEGFSLENYKNLNIARFANQSLPDTLLRVASDGANKIPTFHRKTTEMLIAQDKDTRRLALLIAAFRKYLTGEGDNGKTFIPLEPLLSDTDSSLIKSSDPLDALKATPFASWRLIESEKFVSNYLTSVNTIKNRGMRSAIEETLN